MIKDNSMFEALIPRFPDYELIDSGDFEKLERFGRYVVRRPEGAGPTSASTSSNGIIFALL